MLSVPVTRPFPPVPLCGTGEIPPCALALGSWLGTIKEAPTLVELVELMKRVVLSEHCWVGCPCSSILGHVLVGGV